MTTIVEIPDDRDLTEVELSLVLSLVRWLLKHGSCDSVEFLPPLDRARVASRCSCRCVSIDFAIDGTVPTKGAPMSILSDYEWTDTAGRVFGALVFARSGLLAGLDVWSQDGLSTANILPNIDQLRPIGSATIGEQSHALEPAAGSVAKGKSSPPAQ